MASVRHRAAAPARSCVTIHLLEPESILKLEYKNGPTFDASVWTTATCNVFAFDPESLKHYLATGKVHDAFFVSRVRRAHRVSLDPSVQAHGYASWFLVLDNPHPKHIAAAVF